MHPGMEKLWFEVCHGVVGEGLDWRLLLMAVEEPVVCIAEKPVVHGYCVVMVDDHSEVIPCLESDEAMKS